jgi:hypothetical protein
LSHFLFHGLPFAFGLVTPRPGGRSRGQAPMLFICLGEIAALAPF